MSLSLFLSLSSVIFNVKEWDWLSGYIYGGVSVC